ncbi:aspartyl-phosphate phosphatase Spo0E family protein [Paenibacillus albidus]|uniref:aspartyl-phosphate phosphatase Spo0E family protein n=1 Tax=Paenibacillus albidus TaxID=2041023 RepID=UPI001BEBDB64|nr:aspartyl-phosphate phosphatase Spo0E family protein [Paenibacillus albidus]MBT2289886.1 aspartyl-phosphate phosphatase Spo0E family protein [Paenibacillus albidus]
MSYNQAATLLRVEKARQQLYRTQQRYGLLTHPKVIEQSVKLDELLNQYSINRPLPLY